MPEGPELQLASKFVNEVSEGRLFGGPVQKSLVSKSCDVDFTSPAYSITSESRGKELALTLSCQKDARNRLRLLFRFGMSGRFVFGPATDLHKHAHLNFFTAAATAASDSAGAVYVLSYVDPRRFGSWQVTDGWGKDRGPDPMLEFGAFRSNVLGNLDDAAFNKPICEAMLNQKYFNGIGNYLRAEILYRSRIPPFMRSRDVLAPLKDTDSCSDSSDILQLCHSAPLEVVKLGKYISTYTQEEDMRDSPFRRWLQCYLNPLMSNMVDHNGRTIWFSGEAGPLAPKGGKTRHSGSKLKANRTKSEAVKREAFDGVALELLSAVRCVCVACFASPTLTNPFSHSTSHYIHT